jgi:hypothetical protein
VQPELGAKECNRMLDGRHPVSARGPGQIALEIVTQGFDPSHQRQVHGRALEGILRGFLQQVDWVLSAEAPAVRIDLAEDRFAVRVPDPAEVVRNLAEGRQARRDIAGEDQRRPPNVPCSALHPGVSWFHDAHLH